MVFRCPSCGTELISTRKKRGKYGCPNIRCKVIGVEVARDGRVKVKVSAV